MTDHLPAEYRLCSPDAVDAAAIRALVAACQVAEFGSPDEAMIEGVLVTRTASGFDAARDAWAVAAGNAALAAYGHLGPGERTHRYAHAFVHPAHTGRGLGSWLLARIEGRADPSLQSERLPVAPTVQPGEGIPSGTVTLEQWVAAPNSAARELLRDAGYAEVRHIWGMVIALEDAPESPDWPAGVSVRACAGEADLHLAYRASEEAFRDHWHYEPKTYEQFLESVTSTAALDPSLCFLAQTETVVGTVGEVIGAALCEAYPALGRGWVNSLGVRPAWRGRGIGIALLRHAFGVFRERGLREAALGVDAQNPTGATRLYERAGMRVERQYDVFEKTLS
jgi:GNAT superfamily N-acetyltransferase